MSTFEDCQKFLNFVADCFVEKPVKMDQVKLEKLKAATTSQGSNEDSTLRKSKIHQEDENDDNNKPSEISERQFGYRDVNRDASSHEKAYTLTNIYIYPIKSCGAYEVWTLSPLPPTPLPLILSSSSSPWHFVSQYFNRTFINCTCRCTAGQWDPWVYFMTEAGWWWMETVCAWVRRESLVYASSSHRFTSRQINYCCRHQVRYFIENMYTFFSQNAFQSSGFSGKNDLRYRFFLSRPTGMDTISVPLENYTPVHTRQRVCQSKVCGDRWVGIFKKLEPFRTKVRRHVAYFSIP